MVTPEGVVKVLDVRMITARAAYIRSKQPVNRWISSVTDAGPSPPKFISVVVVFVSQI
jgi:hypothetical protein